MVDALPGEQDACGVVVVFRRLDGSYYILMLGMVVLDMRIVMVDKG